MTDIEINDSDFWNLNRRMWFDGDLRHLLRPNGQTRLRDWIDGWKTASPDSPGPLVTNCHRRFGKSFGYVAMAFGRCLERPHQIVRFGAPTFTQCKEIVEPEIQKILGSCPPELRPKKSGHVWTFKNPKWGDRHATSQFYLIGCRDHAEAHRGKASDMIVLDECALFTRLPYVVSDIFGAHFVGRENPVMILSSTPPTTNDHPFKEEADKAAAGGRYLCIPTTENPDWGERDDKMLAGICGGKQTTAWKREALCEFVTDEGALIVPEFKEVAEAIVLEHEHPPHFYPLVFADFGWIDDTAFLFAYVDWKEGLLIIEDEVVVRKKNTADLAGLIRQKERALWSGNPYPVKRIADNTRQGIDDWRRDHRIFFVTPEDKHDPDQLCATMRSLFQAKKIRISPKCTKLIYQLENGVRDDRGKFERSDRCGHCDAIAALMYGIRMTNFSLNPNPRDGEPGADQVRIEAPQSLAQAQNGRIVSPMRNSLVISRGQLVIFDHRDPRRKIGRARKVL